MENNPSCATGGDGEAQESPQLLPVLEGRRDVPINDALAHRLGAVSHSGACKPLLSHLVEGFSGGQAAFLALLLKWGRLDLSDGFLGVDQFFTSKRQRSTSRSVAANGEGFAASVETVVLAEGDGTGRRYRYVHPVAV